MQRQLWKLAQQPVLLTSPQQRLVSPPLPVTILGILFAQHRRHSSSQACGVTPDPWSCFCNDSNGQLLIDCFNCIHQADPSPDLLAAEQEDVDCEFPDKFCSSFLADRHSIQWKLHYGWVLRHTNRGMSLLPLSPDVLDIID
jgi:hypothetical protein